MATKHPNKHVRSAIKYAEDKGWTFHKAKARAHIFGTLRCPEKSRDGHRIAVYGTPKNPEKHARRIKQAIDKCDH